MDACWAKSWWHKGEIMKKVYQEMNESEKVQELVKIGVPVEEAKKAVAGSQQVELTESHKPNTEEVAFKEVDGSFRPVTKDGEPIRGREGKAVIEKIKSLAECYRTAFDMTEAESMICATVEHRLLQSDEEMLQHLDFSH
jgi:hypothetical protein